MNLESIKLFFGAGNLKSEKLISEKYKFIWIGIPKSAMTSIISALHENSNNRYGTIKTFENLKKILHRNYSYKKYYKFCFVRNPWSRVVSCYLNKIVKGKIKDRDFLKNRIGLKPDMSFNDFVYYLTKGVGKYDFFSDRHWISQYKFITDKKGSIMVDYIGKLENINYDFAKIYQKIGLPSIELPKYNTRFDWETDAENKKKSNDKYYYREYYSEETRKLIGSRYKKDILLFDYKF